MESIRHALIWVGVILVAATSASSYIAVVACFLYWPLETIAVLAAVVAAALAWLTVNRLRHPRPAPAAAPAATAPAAPTRRDGSLLSAADAELRAILGADIFDELDAIDATPATD